MKNNKTLSNAKRLFTSLFISIFLVRTVAMANPLTDSAEFNGLMALGGDIGKALMILSPVVAVCLIVGLLIKKGTAAFNDDQAGGKNYTKSILIVICCCVTGFLIGGILNIVGSYFGVTITT